VLGSGETWVVTIPLGPPACLQAFQLPYRADFN
jgi:hypothetical protein